MSIPLRTLFFSPFPSAFINRWRLQTGKKYRLLANKIRPHCTASYTNMILIYYLHWIHTDQLTQ